MSNGLFMANDLFAANGFLGTADARSTASYLVRCALPTGHNVTKTDPGTGTSYTLNGALGLAPEWETGACDTHCQEIMSACLMAHVNTTGQHINLWMVSSDPDVGWGYTYDYPYQEGSFFGNIFTSSPKAYYCNGNDFDSGVVPGRLGAGQVGAPYADPFGTPGLCRTSCTPSTGTATHLDITSNYPVGDRRHGVRRLHRV